MATKCLSFLYMALVNVVLMVAVFDDTLTAAAKEVKVGGDIRGWHQPDLNHTHFYILWASRRKFYIGDSLRFEYKNDSVLVVDKWGYYHCNSSNPISVFNNGNTVISLDKPGPMYFESGDLDHCEHGQKLLIDVMKLHPKSPPATGTPGEPYSDMAPAPSPLSNSGAKISATMFSVFMASSLAVLTTFIVA